MKIGVYGGSFNPPHLGHVRAAQACKQALGLDRVLVIPASIPPHKQLTSSSASPEDRLALTRLAFEALPGFEVLDLEIRREGKSYTSDTLVALKQKYPNDQLVLICGSDMFLTLSEWHEPETIFRLAVVATAAREKWKLFRLWLKKIGYRLRFGAHTVVVPLTPMEISSSAVREAVRRGEGISNEVPPAVERYIRENHLYE